MQKWLFFTPFFTEEYLRIKMSTSNSKVATFTIPCFHFHCIIKNWFLNIKIHTSHVTKVMMLSNAIVYKEKFVQVSIFILCLDCKILGKCTLKSWLSYGERQAAWTIKLNRANLSNELLFLLKLPRLRNFLANMFYSTTLRLYWIIDFSLHL